MLTTLRVDGSHIEIWVVTHGTDSDEGHVWKQIFSRDLADQGINEFSIRIHKGKPGKEHQGIKTLDLMGSIVSNTDEE